MQKIRIAVAALLLGASLFRMPVFEAAYGGIVTAFDETAVPSDKTVSASGETVEKRVYDYYDVLSDQEEAELEQELEEIYDTYGFEAVILISWDVKGDERKYAAEFMQQNDIGYGADHDGMCLFHQPYRRNISVVFRGEAQYAFDTDIQDLLLDDCTEYLREDDPYGAYEVTLKDLKGGLKRWSEGKKVRPMDISGGIIGYTFMWFGISIFVTAIPVLLMTLYQKGKMKTVVQQPNADAYIPSDGVRLDVERDIYVRTRTTRTKLPKPENPGSSGGHSGGFSSGGEHFSGSSRNY